MAGSSETASSEVAIYTLAGLDGELRQAEIISGLRQFTYDSELDDVAMTVHEYAIVMTQDCDLLWDYQKTSNGGPSELNGVLLYELHELSELRKTLPGSDVWKRVKGNRDERYQALQEIPPELDSEGKGLPALAIDFKRYFTAPAAELYRQLQLDACRRCRLDVVYREHLQSRAAFYLQRVGLPAPHEF